MHCALVSASHSNPVGVATRLAARDPLVRRQLRGRMAAVALPSALFGALLLVADGGSSAKTLHPDHLLMRGDVQQYGDWLVGCDNQAACTMLGFPKPQLDSDRDPAVTGMAIQISLSGPADGQPVVEILPYGIGAKRSGEGGVAGPYVLNVEYEVAAISTPHGFSRQTLLEMEAAAVLRHLAGDRPLLGNYLSNNRLRVRFPQAGFARAFRAMKARQAQINKQLGEQAIDDLSGDAPDGSTLPRSAEHRRIPAIPQIVSGYVPLVKVNQCGSNPARNMQRFAFAGGADLWIYECADGATTQASYFAMSKGSGLKALPLDLPEPRDGKIAAGKTGLYTGDFVFDYDFGILRHHQLIQARSECGIFRAWGYSQNGWQLIERRDMPLCRGLDPSEWVRTYHKPTSGPGPDE